MLEPLGALIWLNNVKGTVLLLSESFHCFLAALLTAFWIESGTGTLFLRLSMLRCVSPLAGLLPRSYQQVTVRRGAFARSLGTRVGLVTALNATRRSRLTGSLPLVQQGATGDVIECLSLVAVNLRLMSAKMLGFGKRRFDLACDRPDKTYQLPGQRGRGDLRNFAARGGQVHIKMTQA